MATVAARVDDRGIHGRTAGGEPLVLTVDGRYIWAFTPARDGHAHRGGVLVEWPPALRQFLAGEARVPAADPARDASTSWTRRDCRWRSTRSAISAVPSPRPTTACATRSWPAPSARCV